MAKNKGGGSKAAAPAKSSGGGLGSQVKSAGSILTKNEALKIAESTGKAVAQVMARAQNNGQGLGSSLVNNYNRGTLGPNGSNVTNFGGVPIGMGPGVGGAATKAIQQLQALEGLRMGQGQVYMGSTTTTTPGQQQRGVNDGYSSTPGSTVYNPIVVPRGYVAAAPKAAAAAAAATPAATGPVGNWENSVNNSNQELINSINAQIAANSTQAELYMGQINDLMKSMQGANLRSITPYATTTSVAPASGAQITQAITARKKPVNTDLSISSLVGDLAGTGLNIGI
jgi:hypothetical protein